MLDADLSDFKIAPDGMFQQCGFAINGVLEPFLTDGDGTTPYSLGMAVLRHVYLIQSQDSHQVGFARLNPDPLQKSVVRPIAQGDDGFRFTLKKYVIYDG